MLISRPAVGPSATAFARSALPPAEALARIAAFPIPRMFVGSRIFPAVQRVEPDVAWDHVGAARLHRLADGGSVTETMIEFTPGVGFAYELIGFTDVFGRLVHGVRGEWSVSPDGDGSLLRWTWEFAPRPFRRALMAHVVAPLWQAYAQRIIVAATATVSAEAVGG
jgi:Polyketide cyclase / dehydrase and lipid transport